MVPLCHHLSTQLNCLIGYLNGIADIAKRQLITCIFLLLILLCLIFPHSICLALGQRRSHICLIVPCIILVLIAFDRHCYCLRLQVVWLIVSYSTAPHYCLASLSCLVIPIDTDYYSYCLIYAGCPTLGLVISSTLFCLYSLSRVSCTIQYLLLSLLRALCVHHLRQTPLGVLTLSPTLSLHDSTCTSSSLESHHYWVAILVVTLNSTYFHHSQLQQKSWELLHLALMTGCSNSY